MTCQSRWDMGERALCSAFWIIEQQLKTDRRLLLEEHSRFVDDHTLLSCHAAGCTQRVSPVDLALAGQPVTAAWVVGQSTAAPTSLAGMLRGGPT
jgi:hypothetical protein